MGVRSETYVMLGYQLKVKEVFDLLNADDEKLDKLQVPWCGEKTEGTHGILVDGMAGGFVLAGLVIAVANEETCGIPLTVIGSNPVEIQAVDDWIDSNSLRELIDTTKSTTPQYIAVTHYH